MKLTADNVHDTFMKCLFKDGEATDNHVKTEGITMTIGFHPARLLENKEKISLMLSDLPKPFHKNGGGGWSFLNACEDEKGNQWADTHKTIEELLLLGIATGQAAIQLPREMWSIFPGGMPYFVVLGKEETPVS